MAYTRKTQYTFLLLASVIVLMVTLASTCDDTCIDRDSSTGVCRETVSDIGTIGSEIGDSFNSDGSIAPFTGNTGKGLCKTTGLNCD